MIAVRMASWKDLPSTMSTKPWAWPGTLAAVATVPGVCGPGASVIALRVSVSGICMA